MKLLCTKSTATLGLLSAAATLALAGRALADVPQIGTVFVIAMENHNWVQPNPATNPQQIFGNPAAPYINSLVTPGNPNAAQVSYATNYLNAGINEHPSEPNYIWAEAGTNYNKDTGFTVNNDADPTAANLNIFSTTPHLTQQMNSAGITWKNYQEDYQILNNTTATGGNVAVSKSGTSTTVTNPYYGTNQYNYAAKHDPMVFFSDTASQNVNTFAQLRADITADTGAGALNNFGRYNWITPNQYNDQHSSLSTDFTYAGTTWTHGTDQEAIAIGDHFLSVIIPQIMATQAYQNNGTIIIWNDETEKSGSSTADDTGHTIMEIIISPLAKGNAYASAVELNHSSDIKTMEEIFQLGGTINNQITVSYGGTAGLNAVPNANDLGDMFVSGTIPAAVPEPASLGILATATCTMFFRRRAARKH